MPELPEMEAYRRMLDPRVRAAPVQRAGPGARCHAEDLRAPARRARRQAARRSTPPRQAPPVPDRGRRARAAHPPHVRRTARIPRGERQAAEAARLQAGLGGRRRSRPHRARLEETSPCRALRSRGDGGRARPPRARRHWASGSERLAAVLAAEPRRLHPLLRDQRAIAGIGRAWSNEILNHARLSPYALSTELDTEEIERLSDAIDEELERGLDLRERGLGDAKVYRVHDRLGEPCPQCGDPDRPHRFRGTYDLLLPGMPDVGAAFSRTDGCRGCSGERAVGGGRATTRYPTSHGVRGAP